MVSKKKINVHRENQFDFLLEESEFKGFFAKDAMLKPVFLYPDDSADKILKKLKKEHINECIVVTKEKKLLGVISDNDIITLFLQQVKSEPLVKTLNRGYRREFFYKTAKDMMSKHKSFVNTDTPMNSVIKLVQKEGFEYIPVLNKAEKVVGVITPSSIIDLLKDY